MSDCDYTIILLSCYNLNYCYNYIVRFMILTSEYNHILIIILPLYLYYCSDVKLCVIPLNLTTIT